MKPWVFLDGVAQCDIARQRYHRDAAPGDRGLNGNLQNARHLFRMRNQFAIVTALSEEVRGFCFLKITAANFLTWNLRGDVQHRYPTAMAIVESVNQMQIAGSATSCANRKPPGKMRFGSSCERGRLFVSRVNPAQALLIANRIRDSV